MKDAWAGVLSALAFAMRATVHTTNRATASQLVFNRDAMRNVGFEADWLHIKARIVPKKNNYKRLKIQHIYGID